MFQGVPDASRSQTPGCAYDSISFEGVTYKEMADSHLKILIAETVDWAAPVTVGSHHYAREFLNRGHEVLWMSQYLHPLSLLTGHWRTKLYRFRLVRGARHEDIRGLSLYAPFSLLPCRRHLLDNAQIAMQSLRFTLPPLRSVLKRLSFDKVDVLWVSNPLAAGLVDLVEHRVAVFRMNDLYSGFGRMPSCVCDLERTLIERSDIVYATSHTLIEHMKRLGGEPTHLPNGADFEHFHTPAPAPAEYRNIPSPRVLYAGVIADWFDSEMVARAARDLPEVSFVLIGARERRRKDALAECRNVYLLGQRPYSELPGYFQHADVGIIPFKVNELTRAVNPNKLYEYFAAGLPAVSTALPEVQQFEPLVKIANNPDEFDVGVRAALEAGKNDGLLQQRLDCARASSWAARFEDVWERIGDALCRSEAQATATHAV